MDCSSILSNVIIGAIGSILATLIIFLLSLVYNSKAKEQRFFDLNYIQKEVWQIENHLGFPDDFDFLMHCMEEVYKATFDISKNIYPSTFLLHPIKKRIAFTLLYDLLRRCELSLFTTEGYEGKTEKQARMNNIRKILYCKENELECSILSDQVEILKHLFSGKSIKYSFKNCINSKVYSRCPDILIEINSFKTESHNWPIQENGISKENFDKIFKKIKK